MSRRRALRLAAIGAAMLVALVGTTLVALPSVVRWLVLSQLSKATGHPVALDALEAGVFRGRVGLRGLRVIDRDGEPLLTVDRVDVRFSPRDLIGGHLRVFDATVQSVALRIVRTGPERFNISELVARLGEGPGSAPALTIGRFALVGGVLTIEDRTLTPPRSWRIEAVELHATDASTLPGARPGAATLHAVAAGATISLSVTDLRLSPLHLRATLNARDVDATLAALYLPPRSPLSPTQGTVTVSATMDHDASTGSLIALDAGFAGVTLHRAGQASAYLSAPAARLTVNGLRVLPGQIALERLAVNAGVIEVEDTRLAPVRRWQVDGVVFEARNLSSAREGPPGIATGRAGTAGARLEMWVTNLRLAPLELHATTIVRNVDLTMVQLYVPSDLPVRAERGVVNATVQVEHGRAGTRVALDASVSDIAVQRPGHWVASPAVRIIAGDIAVDGGAVTAGRVAVVSDRLTLEERTARPVRTWPVENLSMEAKDLSSRREAVQGVARLHAVVAGATVSVFVTGARLAPLELRATAVLRDVDAALLRFYVPAGVPIQLARGRVNATFQVDHATEGTTLTGEAILTGLEAQGRDAFATLAVTSPALRVTIADGRRRGGDLSVGRVELAGAGVFTDSRGPPARFDLTQLRIATERLTWPVTAPARVEVSLRFRDRGELDGSGTARLTAPLPTIAWAAELGLQLRGVELSPLASYIPGADGLGGRVRATVTVDLAYATALTVRVRGDVGGARFALTDGTRTLLALRSINATGLDLQWPDRMTIAQLRLRQPYAFIERDRQARFPLLARFAPSLPPPPAAGTPSGTAPGTARPRMTMTFEEIVVESGRATVVDDGGASPVRFEIPRVGLTARQVTWPASGPAQLQLEAALPAGGTITIEGSVNAEPVSADVTVAVTDADVAWLQPYLGFRARVGGRLSANLTVSGPLAPAPRLRINGDAGLRALDIANGQQSVLTTDQLRITGIDAAWPERISLGRVHARRSWARIERDRQGRFLLHTLLEQPGVGALRPAPSTPTEPAARPAPPPPSAPVPPPGSTPALTVREAVLEEQAATIVDDTTNPPARMDVAGARLTIRDLAWPPGMPATFELTSPMPAGGRLDVSGTVQLEPFRLVGRAVLDGVALEPAQPYLPIDGRVAGKVTGDLSVNIALEPMAIQIAGQARLQGFRLSDGDRAVVTVGRVDTTGIDIDWPTRITVGRVQFRRPRLLVERDAHGQLRLYRLVTPHWGTDPTVASPPATSLAARSAPPPSPTPSTRPTIEIAAFGLERASARFVDHTTTPAYAEELEDLNVTFTPLTTAPGRRTRVTATGVIGGGTLTLRGEGTEGDRRVLDLRVDVQRYIMPRANPYLEKYTGWTATTGSLSVSGSYKLDGAQLETQHDLVVRGLEVAPIGARDEVEQRIGLPLGMLVSLLKDSRGEIRLSVPVAGDVSALVFDYDEAVWGTVRNLAIRLLALPFSKVGSLFFSEDSKVTAVAIAPALFEAGSEHLRPEVGPHLDRVAAFLRGAPAVKVLLDSIAVEADRQALRHEQARARLAGPAVAPPTADPLERARREYSARWPDKSMPATLDAIVAELAATETLPADALRTLATRRLEVVRQRLGSGGIDVARVTGGVARRPFVEAVGAPRVEFDLRP